MSDHHNPKITPRARKAHRCIYCYGPIAVGEVYTQQTGFYEGRPYLNRYHHECWQVLSDDGDFEFSPGEGECPERLTAGAPVEPSPKGQP